MRRTSSPGSSTQSTRRPESLVPLTIDPTGFVPPAAPSSAAEDVPVTAVRWVATGDYLDQQWQVVREITDSQRLVSRTSGPLPFPPNGFRDDRGWQRWAVD